MDTSNIEHYSRMRKELGLPAVMTVEETAPFMRLSETTCYAAVRSGQIPATRVGRQYRIYTTRLLMWLENGGAVTAADSDVSHAKDLPRTTKPTIKRRRSKNAQ